MNHVLGLIKESFINFIPEAFANSDDAAIKEMVDKIDELRQQLVNFRSGYLNDYTIEDLDYLFDPLFCPDIFLPHLAYFVGIEYDYAKSDRENRIVIFSEVKRSRYYGTKRYLREKIEEITGVPPVIREAVSSTSPWDQNMTVAPPASPIEAFGGITWDQIGEYDSVRPGIPFQWFVVGSGLLIDLQNSGVFDPDPIKNAEILDKVFHVVAKYKSAGIPVEVGYVDMVTGQDVVLRYIYSEDIINTVADAPPINPDPGIDF